MMSKQILLLCQRLYRYKGIERPYSYKNIPTKELKAMLKSVDEEGNVLYSHNNLNLLIRIKNQLQFKGVETDIILVGDDTKNALYIDKNLSFLGYDISGDSYYHSPVFRVFHEIPHNSYFEIAQERFKNRLNENGLFKSSSDAKAFITFINTNYEYDIFECDNDVRPMKIYTVNGSQ